MKGFESIQAWIDGKILVQLYFGDQYKFDEEKMLVCKGLEDKEWKLCMIPYNALLGMEFDEVIEYPLSFENALRQMLDGKIVESEGSKRQYKLYNGVLHDLNDGVWDTTVGFDHYEQTRMWKVVE